MERIGKKYQWIAFYELLARLGDNVGFVGWRREDSMRVFEGPWELSRRNMDPSLFASRMPEEKRQSDRTWWMPFQVTLKSVSPQARLTWLDSADDIVNDSSLLSVVDPIAGREWLVIDEYEGWTQWGVQEGDRSLERQTWFFVICLLVQAKDREIAIETLMARVLDGHDSFTSLDIPEGYIGEYPWHPLYEGVDTWIRPDDWNGLRKPLQPTVTEYRAERSGHDYSIEDTVKFHVPAPGLFAGLELRLTNGRDLTYANADGRVVFFDPSTKEPGPGAALVDRQEFLDFLKRDGLEAVWVITGTKEAFGGKKRDHGYGGARSFASVYWLTENGFERRDREEFRRPTKDQLKKFFDEEGVDSIQASVRATKGTRATAKRAKKGSRSRKKKAPVAKRSAKKKKSIARKTKPIQKPTQKSTKSKKSARR
ncbi:hypothetical protein ACFLEY_18775 [Bradyrhizobium sp. YCK136]|uniref:hypothetical protein n=1 Tax=Bradyrhizobium TaxID=374 RepID=UPI001B8CFCFB|nr:hypothetical protein [Bradyrhizobium diazoefficiens]MBR0863593.1 hypothetical protein [Bradyrhizobium diazoefficiens]MBR0888037.1 hypothetical protein [Bradyrhizobium diazoefficiens]MBR0919919.1 hypothetical protein [Bradyrhizobium diazoefficiens]